MLFENYPDIGNELEERVAYQNMSYGFTYQDSSVAKIIEVGDIVSVDKKREHGSHAQGADDSNDPVEETADEKEGEGLQTTNPTDRICVLVEALSDGKVYGEIVFSDKRGEKVSFDLKHVKSCSKR